MSTWPPAAMAMDARAMMMTRRDLWLAVTAITLP
jgi:hypothetical protein